MSTSAEQTCPGPHDHSVQCYEAGQRDPMRDGGTDAGGLAESIAAVLLHDLGVNLAPDNPTIQRIVAAHFEALREADRAADIGPSEDGGQEVELDRDWPLTAAEWNQLQTQYDAAHAALDHHCLAEPCPWHPFEQRIRPTPTSPAALAGTDPGDGAS